MTPTRWLAAGGVVVGATLLGAGAVVAYGLTASDTWSVEREVLVDAAPDDVAWYLEDVGRWRQWMFVGPVDDTEILLGQLTSGTGAAARWRTGRRYGRGAIEQVAPGRFGLRLFRVASGPEPDAPAYESVVTIELNATPDGGTELVWTDTGAIGTRPVGPFLVGRFSRTLALDVDEALARLGAVAEARAEARREGIGVP